MGQTGSNLNPTINAWTEITMKVLFQRMDVWGWGNEANHLRDSLRKGKLVFHDLGNDRFNMSMSFNLYGRFVDIGTGKDVSTSNISLEINSETKGLRTVRRPKEWLSGYWWAQLQRLREIVRDKYSAVSVTTVIDELANLMGHSKSTRGFQYAVSQSARNARNYARRRALPGRWTNNHKTWKPDRIKKIF